MCALISNQRLRGGRLRDFASVALKCGQMTYILLIAGIFLLMLVGLVVLVLVYYWGPNGPPKK